MEYQHALNTGKLTFQQLMQKVTKLFFHVWTENGDVKFIPIIYQPFYKNLIEKGCGNTTDSDSGFDQTEDVANGQSAANDTTAKQQVEDQCADTGATKALSISHVSAHQSQKQ